MWIPLSRNSFWNSGGGGRAATSSSVMRGDILLFTILFSSWDNFQYLIFVLFYDWLVNICWLPIQVGQILTCQPEDNVYPKGEDVLISNLSGHNQAVDQRYDFSIQLSKYFKIEVKIWAIRRQDCTVPKRVPIIGAFLAFWVPIYISRSLFPVFWLH